jgi:DHA1 family tetracycline resistance protein-like MFS transporter
MTRPAGPHAAVFVHATILIFAMGIGIILPVMPDLIRDLTDLSVSEAAFWGGFLTMGYASMQFLLSPTVGNLSDRFGRRPVLIISLAALAIDYVVMALAPTLWVLFVGRIIAGAAGATMATANAFMSDISTEETRAQNFAMVSAVFGAGFILGPLIGGVAGEFGPRVPFMVAAALSGACFVYGWFFLPESLAPENRRPFSWARANPIGTARQIARLPAVAWFLAAFFLYEVGHYAYASVWAFYGQEAFGWSPAEVGLSLAAVGVGFVVVQGWLIRIVLTRLGSERTAWVGLILTAIGLALLSLATEGWMAYAVMPVTVLGLICVPAIRALMANRVSEDAQGELQGAISAALGITMILSPVLMTQVFVLFTGPQAPVYLPGAPFALAAIITMAAFLPFALGLRRG